MVLFFFISALLPNFISALIPKLGSSRLAVSPDSGPAGKGLVWEVFISRYLDVRCLLGTGKGMCQSSIGSFEILFPVANVLPSFNIKYLN